MKALSVRQPWASLIASGAKTIELRSWPTRYRGELLICASKSADAGATPEMPRGVALVVVEVTDCRPFEPADAEAACVPWRPGLHAWVLRVLYRVDPLPVVGKLSFFKVETPLTPMRKSPRIRP